MIPRVSEALRLFVFRRFGDAGQLPGNVGGLDPRPHRERIRNERRYALGGAEE